MSAYLRDLKNIFHSFCQFGASKSSLNDLQTAPVMAMDNARFAKFAKDSRILDKHLTMTDVDIIFNKIKNKGSRRLEFEDFIKALRELAMIKYQGALGQDAFTRLAGEICRQNQGPIAVATIPAADSTLQRLTDTSKYTGSHKLRFDENGKGLGLAGRDEPSRTDTLAKLTNREPATIRGVPLSAARSTGSLAPATKSAASVATTANLVPVTVKRAHSKIVSASTERMDGVAAPAKFVNQASSKGNLSKPVTPSYAAKSGSGNIFDRLTDPSKYTGTHKQRFNPDGTGRGLAGRDPIIKGAGSVTAYHGGDVKSLAQILRN